MRRTLIFLPGDLDGIFVNKEYPYLDKVFDNIIVIGNGDDKKVKELSVKYPFKFINIKKNHLINIFAYVKWLFSDEFKMEFIEYFRFSKEGLYKLMYSLFYGLSFIKYKATMENILYENENCFIYSFWLSRPAYIAAKFSNFKHVVKTVSRAHGFDLYLERNKYNYLPFRKYIYENLDEISFISKQGEKYFQDKSSLKIKSSVHRLGIDCNVNSEINYIENRCVIISCSSITEVKRLDLIIDTLSELNSNYKWYHIGTGNLYEDLKKYAEKKLSKNSFVFLGNISNDKILQLYNEINPTFFINLSDSEGIPVSMMEALSLGIPIIARNVGGVAEIVNDNVGLLLNDSIPYADQIDSFIRKVNIEKNFYLIKEQCISNWQKYYKAETNFLKFYRNLIDIDLTNKRSD